MSLLSDKKVSQELERSWKAKLKSRQMIAQKGSVGVSVGRRIYNLLTVGLVLGVLSVITLKSVNKEGDLMVVLLSGVLFVMSYIAIYTCMGFMAPRDGFLLASTPISEKLAKRHTLTKWYMAICVWVLLLGYMIFLLNHSSSASLWMCIAAVSLSFLTSIACALVVRLNIWIVIISALILMKLAEKSTVLMAWIEYTLPSSWGLLLLPNTSNIDANYILVLLSCVLAVYAVWQLAAYVREWRYNRIVFNYDFYHADTDGENYDDFENEEEIEGETIGDVFPDVTPVGKFPAMGLLDRILEKWLTVPQGDLVSVFESKTLTSRVKSSVMYLIGGIIFSNLQRFVDAGSSWESIVDLATRVCFIFAFLRALPLSLPGVAAFEIGNLSQNTQVVMSAMFPINVRDLCMVNLKSAVVKSIVAIPLMIGILYFSKWNDHGSLMNLMVYSIMLYIGLTLFLLVWKLKYGPKLNFSISLKFRGLGLLFWGFLIGYLYFFFGAVAMMLSNILDYGFYADMLFMVVLGGLTLWITLLDYRNMRLDKVYQEK